ncbi:sulfotransferase [Salipiger aestuarii]|uniref:Sulfotransferase domain-containing protein n=1 Tax=Salipiger aestuarii TaxID=568098 RepID=A0A327XYS3_9RHOB|nr:sulfotransferase domain-containing protein [Salipiger aestuarii]EIE48641.1 sulfotransferase [Citreicella sp. 357]KAA8606548.1 sulfotransferase [Salipiger aestuarii]KAA8610048.1 sulfotransferase [Salipiger aestuarii]KAB2541216.1 sulfotransferase [Salipiger aestuarii]RAK13873.1 sulfotransferase domain-containing protein [Salipiger aestuarii]
MRPGLIGIGAQKCASSWLHAIAGSHPEIGISDPKEVDFFSYYFDRGYAWYEEHFAPDPSARVCFESSPSYFHDPRAPGRAYAYRADLKVLALLRDPLKRAFSNHLHEIIKGHIAPCSFEDGLANNPAYLEQGLYATHLSRWFDAFPADQLRVMFAEEISTDARAAARDVFSFCGVDPAFDSPILLERRNESDRARMPVLRTGLRAGGDWLRRQGMEPALARLKQTGPVSALLKANKIDIRREIPPMTAETRTRLTEYFTPEMDRLRQMLARDCLPWETMRLASAS